MRAEQFTLSNGLKVVHLELPHAQQYSLSLDVPVGAIHDPVGKEGISHILEHTVFTGSKETSEKDLSRILKSAGGNYGAYTSCDETVYEIWSLSSNPENFGIIADTLRQFITEPEFNPDRLKLELGVIVNELRDSMDNVSRSATNDLYHRIGKGPYRDVDIIGTQETIQSVTREDLREFIRGHYDAGRMTLFVVGPLNARDAKEILDGTLSAIPNLGKPELPRFHIEVGKADMRTHAPELLQNNSIFMFCNQSPRTFRDYAIDNYARVNIGNSFFAELRRRYGCFYRAEFGGWLNSNGANITYISTSHQPEDSKNVALGISDFYNELETILTDDVIKGAIERERFYLSKPEQINITISDLVKRKYQVDGGALDVGEYCDILGAIQPSEVREKIHEIFDGLCGVAVKGPEPMAMPDLDSIKKTFCRRQDVSREYKAAVAGPTCDIY